MGNPLRFQKHANQWLDWTASGLILELWKFSVYSKHLWSLSAGQKQQVQLDMEQQTGSKLGKEYIKYILSPCLFNIYAEYIMWNARLDEAHSGIKIAGRNINNLRYEDDTTLMAESEELKRFLMKVKEDGERGQWKSWLKTQHSEN